MDIGRSRPSRPSRHPGVPPNVPPGTVIDREGGAPICATHGARYDPPTGACLGGPCAGAALIGPAVRETGGQIRLAE